MTALRATAASSLIALAACGGDGPSGHHAPFVQQANPPELTTAVFTPGGGTSFAAVVGDPDLHDSLYVRWLIDYPPYDLTVTRHVDRAVGPAQGQDPARGVQRFSPNCFEHSIAPGMRQHKIMLLVADRPFASFDDLEALTDLDGQIVKVGWLLDGLACGAGGTTQ